ncbi:uncharacterized protein [Rutidosis leptorrhynchoides]|uniref:uncharacterized protein n=1 Tax=Rutidosis leptorrhynchoides TaxID=125765 RepID=UPI003A99F70D
MMNSKGFFFFKFATESGMLEVLESSPWMIRTIPIILNKWSPNVSLAKEDHSKVPVWIKMHDIPLVGYTDVGLSVIASKLGKPMMLDSFTSTMCVESWGRPSFARALIEVSTDNVLKETLKIATPSVKGGNKTVNEVRIEYEWNPPRCSGCKVFGHKDDQCPKNVIVTKAQEIVVEDGFKLVQRKKLKGIVIGNQVVADDKIGTSKDKQVKVQNSFGALNSDYNLMDEPSDIESDEEETAKFMAAKNVSMTTAPLGSSLCFVVICEAARCGCGRCS